MNAKITLPLSLEMKIERWIRLKENGRFFSQLLNSLVQDLHFFKALAT